MARTQQQAGLVSSFGPDVYFEDLTYNFRDHAQISVAYPSSVNPNLWFVASDDGHIWRSDDDGKTWTETRVIVAPNSFYGDQGQRMFYGANRRYGRAAAARGSSTFRRGPGRQGAAWSVTTPTARPQRAHRLQSSVQLLNRFEDMWMLRGPRAPLYSGLRSRNLLSFNRAQLIALRGQRNPELWFPIPHPTDEKIVWLTTFYGLFTSWDGGHTFVRDFVGNTPTGHDVYDVAVDPSNPKRVFLATGEGMYVSSDGGRNYLRHPGKGVGEWMAFATAFHPKKPKYVFVCGDHGLLRSADGGRNFDIIYWSTRRREGVCRRVIFDNFHPTRAYIGTFDGLFVTDDILSAGLDSWRRLGGSTFYGMRTRALYACTKHRGHMWVLAWVNLPRINSGGSPASGIGFHGGFVFESLDHGKSWKPMFSGYNASNIIWAVPVPRDPDMLLIMAARSLLRMKRKKPDEPRRVLKSPIRPDPLPPISEVIQAAMHFTGTDPRQQLGYRARARYKALLPRVHLSYAHNMSHRYALLEDGIYPTLPYRKNTSFFGRRRELRVIATWDLSPLTFNLQTTWSGREHRLIAELRERVVLEAHQAYARLVQLRAILANVPPEKLYLRMMYRTRIAETTALLDFITGNYLEQWRNGRKVSGRATRWWRPWPRRP